VVVQFGQFVAQEGFPMNPDGNDDAVRVLSSLHQKSGLSQERLLSTVLMLLLLLIAAPRYVGEMGGESGWLVMGRLEAIPVLLAGILVGWRVGLGLGVITVILHAITAGGGLLPFDEPERGSMVLRVLEILSLPLLGLLAGVFSARYRRRLAHHQRLAEELQRAHAEMQENFDGMKRAERLFALGQLSAGLAHEIRNPLASISGAAGILRRSGEAHKKHEELLEIIDKECQRLNRLLTNFLEFARPRPPQPTDTALETVLRRVVQLASHAPGRRDIAVRLHIDAAIPTVRVDAEQLEQVLLNMVMNAVQASADGDEVLLSARLEGDRLWVDVRDQGSGVKPEHVDRLFDPFFTTKEQGTGLGLPVAHEIVRSIGGMLKVKHNEDRGMTFSVGLPRSDQSNHTDQSLASTAEHHEDTSNPAG
jgi:two-component system, NtrC family, sensor histidine kinase HydH